MSDTIEACPACGSSSLYNNNPDSYRGRGEAKQYGCYGCHVTFDEPDTRERRVGGGRNGLAKRLLEADPDDVRADGGTVRGIEPGDVCIDLAQGTTVQVVDVAAETVDEWQQAHDYDLLGNYANERLGAMYGEPVFTCVYANSIRSEPSKTYDFPASRLARVEHENAHGERVQDVLAIELLADLFETANASTDDPWPGDLSALARDAGVDSDVLRAASELGETRVKEDSR